MKKMLLTAAAVLALSSGAAMAEWKNCPHHSDSEARIEEALSGLPEDKATLIKTTLSELREEGKSMWSSKKEKRQAMQNLLTAETFDKDAYMAKAKEIQESRASMFLSHQERIAELASQLNAEERAALAKAMPKHGKMRGKKHERKDSE